MCYLCSRTAANPSPARFHLHPQCHLPMQQLSWTKATPRGLPLPHSSQTCSHTHAAAGPGRAEASRRWGWQRWGRLEGGTCFFFVARTHLSLCSITLNHHIPQVCSSASLTAAVCPRWQPPPRGILSQIRVGGVGEGRGVRHNGGGGEECAPLRRFPRMGQGGGHPSMSQLKRWCFTSMSCTPSFSGFFSFSSLFIGSSQS